MTSYYGVGEVSCSRRIQFCSGHRVVGHENKCSSLHGHNYVAIIEAKASHLDKLGRVVDFSVLKERVGSWIESNWDHGLVLSGEDETSLAAVSCFNKAEDGLKQKVFVLPYNPTAENMAKYLGEVVCPDVLSGLGVYVSRIELAETENCKATWSL